MVGCTGTMKASAEGKEMLMEKCVRLQKYKEECMTMRDQLIVPSPQWPTCNSLTAFTAVCQRIFKVVQSIP